MTIQEEYHQKLADTLIKNLKKRQMDSVYCATAKEAADLALSYVPSGSKVSFGGSMSLTESGIMDCLRGREDITLFDRSAAKTPEEIKQVYHDALSSDYYFMSTNALTIDGELVNIDGNGNRLAALIYGPEHVIIVCSLNKVVSDVEAAVSRVRNQATPPNCNRISKATPCASTGVCADCFAPDCICNQIVVTRRSGNPDRIKIILVGENLGY